jgi:hypothetical protein
MKIISHRGNIDGPDPSNENNPKQILKAIKNGFDVEIDVWFIKSKGYFLGHDKPVYPIDKKFLINKKLWCHAKNFKALEKMQKDKLHYFWHEKDKITLTSLGILWCYPGTYTKSGITVMLSAEKPKQKIYGVCTDYPILFV